MLKAYAPFNLLLNAAAIEQSRSLDDDSVNVNRYHDHHRQKNNASFKGELSLCKKVLVELFTIDLQYYRRRYSSSRSVLE